MQSERVVGELRDEVKTILDKTRTLQEFFDKYDIKMEQQRTELTDQIRANRKASEDVEKELKKKLQTQKGLGNKN